MKKIFKIMVVTCLTLCMFSMSQVSALDDESDLIERCFNGQTMIIHNGKDVTDVVKEKYKSEYANKNFDTIIEDFEKNNYDFITQDDGNGIKPRASSTVLNGYYWETYYNSIRSKVFVYAQVTYNANTGAYMSRTKALGKFSVKGSNTSACGVDQSLSSATVYKSASVPYVNYHPAAFIRYKDGTYRYMKDWKFNVKCYSNAQPKPYM